MVLFIWVYPPLSTRQKNKNQALVSHILVLMKIRGLKFQKIGPEWGRHGSPRAHTPSQRSHGLQEAF